METDSSNDIKSQTLLKECVYKIKNVSGIFCEMGLRKGGGSEIFMNYFLENNDKRIFIAIDPYGDIEYQYSDSRICDIGVTNYSNEMRRETLANIYKFCHEKSLDFYFFCLEDKEFFKRYGDGIPIYDRYKRIENKYALVYLDGPHGTDLIINEILFFAERLNKGGIIIFDDLDKFNWSIVCDFCLNLGFILLNETNNKAAFQLNK